MLHSPIHVIKANPALNTKSVTRNCRMPKATKPKQPEMLGCRRDQPPKATSVVFSNKTFGTCHRTTAFGTQRHQTP